MRRFLYKSFPFNYKRQRKRGLQENKMKKNMETKLYKKLS